MERFILSCIFVVAMGLTITGLWSIFGPQKHKPHLSIPIMMLIMSVIVWLAFVGALRAFYGSPLQVNAPGLP